jgi:glycosyltransferase involved in cell wall biosynthesis
MSRSLGIGGSERQLTEIARSLDRSRFEPHVGCFHAGGFRTEELLIAGVPVVEFPVKSFIAISALTGLMAMGRYLEAHRIRLVHTFDLPANLFGVPAARLFRVPHVISSQRAHRALTPGLRRRLLRVTDRLVDAIVVNSESVRRELIEVDRVLRQLIHLCPNGVDTAIFRPSTQSRAGPVVIGAVGALRPEKSLETLLEAFGRIIRGVEARLLIAGDGPSRAGLEDLARRLAVEDRCTFAPATKDVPARLRAIDIFVLPSRSEALSNALMEAMACGCCVVASQAGGTPELVCDRENGLLFPPGDAQALAACLELLLSDPALRARLAAAGAERIRKEFSIESAAARIEEIYNAVLER